MGWEHQRIDSDVVTLASRLVGTVMETAREPTILARQIVHHTNVPCCPFDLRVLEACVQGDRLGPEDFPLAKDVGVD